MSDCPNILCSAIRDSLREELAAVKAENEKLREALESIAKSSCACMEAPNVARQALASIDGKGGEEK